MESDGRAALPPGRVPDPGQAEPCSPDVVKLGGPVPMLVDLVQMTSVSCLNVRVCKRRRRMYVYIYIHTYI